MLKGAAPSPQRFSHPRCRAETPGPTLHKRRGRHRSRPPRRRHERQQRQDHPGHRHHRPAGRRRGAAPAGRRLAGTRPDARPRKRKGATVSRARHRGHARRPHRRAQPACPAGGRLRRLCHGDPFREGHGERDRPGQDAGRRGRSGRREPLRLLLGGLGPQEDRHPPLRVQGRDRGPPQGSRATAHHRAAGLLHGEPGVLGHAAHRRRSGHHDAAGHHHAACR